MDINKPILVLSGGFSEESEVSKVSAGEIAGALNSTGHDVIILDPSDFSCYSNLVERIKEIDPLIVFNGLHGAEGEDGRLQALFELENILYTGSDYRACALAMDKYLTSMLVTTIGIKTPDKLIYQRDSFSGIHDLEVINLPLVVKPNDSGSSVGITIIDDLKDAESAFKIAGQYSSQVLFEEFIPGKEITVTILNEEALPVVEIIPQTGWYDYSNKYTKGHTRYQVPASIDRKSTARVQSYAKRIFHLLGCKVYSRVDFRYDGKEFFFLEINTLPGMTTLSLTPMAAKEAGIDFPELLIRIIDLSLNK